VPSGSFDPGQDGGQAAKYRYQNCADLIKDLENLGLANPTLSFLQAVTLRMPRRRAAQRRQAVRAVAIHADAVPEPAPEPVEDVWYVRYRRPNGQPVLQKLTTAQVLRTGRLAEFDSRAKASRSPTTATGPWPPTASSRRSRSQVARSGVDKQTSNRGGCTRKSSRNRRSAKTERREALGPAILVRHRLALRAVVAVLVLMYFLVSRSCCIQKPSFDAGARARHARPRVDDFVPFVMLHMASAGMRTANSIFGTAASPLLRGLDAEESNVNPAPHHRRPCKACSATSIRHRPGGPARPGPGLCRVDHGGPRGESWVPCTRNWSPPWRPLRDSGNAAFQDVQQAARTGPDFVDLPRPIAPPRGPAVSIQPDAELYQAGFAVLRWRHPGTAKDRGTSASGCERCLENTARPRRFPGWPPGGPT